MEDVPRGPLNMRVTNGAASNDPKAAAPPIFHAFSLSLVRAYTLVMRRMI